MGIYVEAITNPNGPTTNMFDFRFNYWGSELGPVRGPNVAQDPLLAPSDSSRIIGHVPFNHTTGSSIAQHPGQPYGRWIVYPVAVTPNDATAGTCGWQYQTMQAAVLRVNGNGDQLLGMYNRIFDARNNSLPLAYPVTTGTRTGTDQIFVIAQSTYGPNTFGYNGTVESEGSGNYPITFFADPQPSVIRGINRPTIYTDESGSIRVTSDFPRGFVAKDFINHVSFGSGTYTGISFENNHPNIVDYNFFAATQPNPVSYTGIRYNSSSTADANNVQTFTNNRINLGQSPGWPGGPAVTSAPLSFKGIDIVDRGPFGGNAVNISNNEISVGQAAGTRSIGIDVNATNINNFGSVSGNQIRHMAAGNADVSNRASKWGTGIYVTRGTNFSINNNDIAGGNEIGIKGHDGITLDRPTNFLLTSNSIATRYASLKQENWVSLPMRGYGIKLFSSNGSGDVNGVDILSNNIGSPIFGCASAAVYTGGTSGNVNTGVIANAIYGSNVPNTGSSCNCAAVQVATGVYSDTPSSGTVRVESNDFGVLLMTSNHSHNSLDLAIGTNSVGTGRLPHANNLIVDVQSNHFTNLGQNAILDRATIVDGRPSAGSNIRNIFGRGNWANIVGSNTPGQGTSGNNRFSHGTILTGESNLANYSIAMSRTANAQQLNPASSTEPVKIWRRITEPMAAARSTDSINTVEVRENMYVSDATNAGQVYNESIQFPDQRVLLLGPINQPPFTAFIRPSTTPVAITSIGRENKDIRGGISLWMNNSSQLYGQIPGSSTLGAVNKGDVYVQGANLGSDPGVRFFYFPISASVPITGLSNSSDLTTDIKAGIDDADDNLLAPGGADTRHRTGVFVRGNGSSFTKQDVPTAVTGSTLINAYPNPANSDVTVSFIVPINGMVRIALYNALGQKVTDLREEYLNAANYTTSFNVSDLPSGTYHVRMSTEGIDAPLTTSVTVIK
jgi:hypothetical protein